VKTVQDNPKSHNLTQTEALNTVQNRPLRRPLAMNGGRASYK